MFDVNRPSTLTRMNQHPLMHQLAILFRGWVVFFNMVHDLALTNNVPQSTFFNYWTLTFSNCFLPNPNLHIIFPLSYPIDLTTL
jgi:hypothetical protein